MTRKASIKETGEEVSQAEWERFDAAVAEIQAERPRETTRDTPAKGGRLEHPDAPERGGSDRASPP